MILTVEQAAAMPIEDARERIVTEFAQNLHPDVVALLFVVNHTSRARKQSAEQVFIDIRQEAYARGGKRSLLFG